ncbi:flagellar biosynthesis protein FlhF [Pseudomonas aeruginosa]|nr:flagellar biosynthesis protein FlhF [Pseudomonas aeruginosa]
MQVKRFFAADMRQAMKLVRDELGPDAAILGNRRVAGGIELTAALDYQAPPAPSKPNPALEVELRKTQARIAEARAELTARPAENQRKDRQLFAEEKPARPSPGRVHGGGAGQAPGGRPDPRGNAFRTERPARADRGTTGFHCLGPVAAPASAAGQSLAAPAAMGLPAELSKPLLERVAAVGDTRQAWRMLLAHLSRAVQTPEQDPLDAGGVLALVGPAGAGKTTTLAKMAARYVLKYGAQSLALVSMDSYRIGAQEQIKTLGRILNVPVTLVDPGQSLIQALAPLARKRMVLIDTAGLPASDPALRMQLEALASPSLNVKNYLVMATTSQSQVLKSAYQTYRHCGLAGCILTKLDEAGSLGESMALAIAQRLPVAYLADGPRIPDDLQVARSHQLVSRAVSLQAPEEPSEDAMAELFAGLYQQPARRAG